MTDARLDLLRRIVLETASTLQAAADSRQTHPLTANAWSVLADELYRAQEIASQFCQETERKETADTVSRGNCGECLMNDVEIVALGADGICPRCKVDYSKPE